MRSVGLNQDGQLGDGTQNNAASPVKFDAPTTLPIVAAYSNFLSSGNALVAIDSAGNAYAAGLNDTGQLGVGSASANVTTPAKVILPVGSQVVGDNGKVYGAGGNLRGQLGNGTTSGLTPNPNPVAVNGIDGVNIQAKMVQIGRGTTVIYANGNRVFTVGDNTNGQLGDPSYVGTYSTSIILNQYVNKFIPIQY